MLLDIISSEFDVNFEKSGKKTTKVIYPRIVIGADASIIKFNLKL